MQKSISYKRYGLTFNNTKKCKIFTNQLIYIINNAIIYKYNIQNTIFFLFKFQYLQLVKTLSRI